MTQAYNLSQVANFANTSGQIDASAGLFNEVQVANGGTGAGTATDAKIGLEVITAATGSQILPVGTEAERDGSPEAGYIRFNSDFSQFEGYNGTSWGAIGSGAQGGGNNPVFFENDQTVTVSYTITTNKNAMSAGPITIDDGVTVTVPTNSTWTIV
jgi:hypothetical protein